MQNTHEVPDVVRAKTKPSKKGSNLVIAHLFRDNELPNEGGKGVREIEEKNGDGRAVESSNANPSRQGVNAKINSSVKEGTEHLFIEDPT